MDKWLILLISSGAFSVTSKKNFSPVIASIDAMRQLSHTLPAASLRLVPDAGHYILFSHWLEIWRDMRLAHTGRVMRSGCPGTRPVKKGVV
jgi:hypothetical protein